MVPDEPEKVPIFVYGTLMKSTMLDQVGFKDYTIEPAVTTGQLFWFPGSFPGMITEGKGTIHGKAIFAENLEHLLSILDFYEGVTSQRPPFYVRRKIPIGLTASGEQTVAWAYVLNEKSPIAQQMFQHPLDHGDWEKASQEFHNRLEYKTARVKINGELTVTDKLYWPEDIQGIRFGPGDTFSVEITESQPPGHEHDRVTLHTDRGDFPFRGKIILKNINGELVRVKKKEVKNDAESRKTV